MSRYLRLPDLRLPGSLFLIALLCALFVPSRAAQTLKGKNGKRLQVGLQLYSVRADCAKDLPGVLKTVSKMGYTGVEFAGYHGRTAAELRQMLHDNKLQCYGTHVDLNALQGDNLEKTMTFCQALGCKLVIVPWLPVERRNSKQTVVETAHLFNDVAQKMAARGLRLGWHNEDYEFKPIEGTASGGSGGETIWDAFTANTDNSVALQFDTGNALSAGVQAAPFLLKYPARFVSVHVKDHSATNPNALLGEGDEHWNEVIPILKNKTATQWFIIEQESYGEPPLVCVEKCLRNFEKLWNSPDGHL
jgi:sugar phosphate isomerase/epimerase